MFIDCTLDISNDRQLMKDALCIIRQVKPSWKSGDISSKVYSEGLTNTLIGFWFANFDDQVIIRIAGNGTEAFIDRQSEINNIKMLHKHGLASEVYATFRNGVCYSYVPGVPLDRVMIRDETIQRKVVESMAKFHKIKLDPGTTSNIFGLIRRLLALLPEKILQQIKPRLSNGGFSMEYISSELDELEVIIKALNSPIVFCHNDLLMNNLIWQKETQTLHFIDFEYSAPNYQHFDIANHFNEYAGTEDVDYSLYPDSEYARNWIKMYLECYQDRPATEEEIEDFWQKVRKFSLVSHLLWGAWALTQTVFSKIDFDYIEYSLIRLREYRAKKTLFLASS